MRLLIRILHPAFLSAAILALSAAWGRAQSGPFTNSLGMKFVPIPGTKILMCTTDTTVAQYKAAGLGYQAPKFPQGSDHPAVNVSWNDARAWCHWLSKKEGRKYRLPNDEEWNLAVGGGLYPGGNQWPPPSNCGNYAGQEMRSLSQVEAERYLPKGFNLIKGFSDRHVFTSPVGSYPANMYGLSDMGGNVWQWCDDWFDGTHQDRILRGASWKSVGKGSLQSTYRASDPPAHRESGSGFRTVLVISGG